VCGQRIKGVTGYCTVCGLTGVPLRMARNHRTSGACRIERASQRRRSQGREGDPIGSGEDPSYDDDTPFYEELHRQGEPEPQRDLSTIEVARTAAPTVGITHSEAILFNVSVSHNISDNGMQAFRDLLKGKVVEFKPEEVRGTGGIRGP